MACHDQHDPLFCGCDRCQPAPPSPSALDLAAMRRLAEEDMMAFGCCNDECPAWRMPEAVRSLCQEVERLRAMAAREARRPAYHEYPDKAVPQERVAPVRFRNTDWSLIMCPHCGQHACEEVSWDPGDGPRCIMHHCPCGYRRWRLPAKAKAKPPEPEGPGAKEKGE